MHTFGAPSQTTFDTLRFASLAATVTCPGARPHPRGEPTSAGASGAGR